MISGWSTMSDPDEWFLIIYSFVIIAQCRWKFMCTINASLVDKILK